MNLSDIKYRLNEWIKLNYDFLKRVKENYQYPKRTDIIFNDELINTIKSNYTPVFVLSTGRCGTEYLTRILEVNDQTKVYHSPHPELIIASKFAYENHFTKREIIKNVVESARIELILNSYLRNKIFIETNNKITFFAFAISEIFSKSKFIHLTRHPGDFVSSGLNRKWYMNSSNHDLGRIVPINEKIDFESFNQIQKIGWLWNETNLFIEKFKKILNNPNRLLTIKSEDLFGNISTINSIYKFIDSEYSSGKKLNSILTKKTNVQKIIKYPKYDVWNKEDKESLASVCTIADIYGYRLS